MDVSSGYFSKKLLFTSDILLFWRRRTPPIFVRYFEILIFAVVQSNELLFAFGGKFELMKNQPIRPHYSKSSILIDLVGEQICALCPVPRGPQEFFCYFENSWEIRPSLKRQQQNKSNSMDERK